MARLKCGIRTTSRQNQGFNTRYLLRTLENMHAHYAHILIILMEFQSEQDLRAGSGPTPKMGEMVVVSTRNFIVYDMHAGFSFAQTPTQFSKTWI